MDTTVKVTSIHLIFGIIAAFLSYVFTIGWLGFKNDVFAGILPLTSTNCIVLSLEVNGA